MAEKHVVFFFGVLAVAYIPTARVRCKSSSSVCVCVCVCAVIQCQAARKMRAHHMSDLIMNGSGGGCV